jgi:hypothetical protein
MADEKIMDPGPDAVKCLDAGHDAGVASGIPYALP